MGVYIFKNFDNPLFSRRVKFSDAPKIISFSYTYKYSELLLPVFEILQKLLNIYRSTVFSNSTDPNV